MLAAATRVPEVYGSKPGPSARRTPLKPNRRRATGRGIWGACQERKTPELSLRGRDLQSDCAFDQNERVMRRRPLKPSVLFW
jgi:hypothetical protein